MKSKGEGENKEGVRKKVAYLRGLRRCCSAQSYIQKNNSADDNSHTSPSRITRPVGGAFVDSDSNAATNIALKLFQASTVNDNACTAPSSANLSRGVSVKQPSNIFWPKTRLYSRHTISNYTVQKIEV